MKNPLFSRLLEDFIEYLRQAITAHKIVVFKFLFKYNDETIMIWAWKGDYINLGAGAELGIYHGKGFHWQTGTEYAMPMTLQLFYKGNELFYWTPEEDNWWITGFDPQHQYVSADDITAVYTLDFSKNQKMFSALRKEIKANDSRWSFDPITHKATFKF